MTERDDRRMATAEARITRAAEHLKETLLEVQAMKREDGRPLLKPMFVSMALTHAQMVLTYSKSSASKWQRQENGGASGKSAGG